VGRLLVQVDILCDTGM